MLPSSSAATIESWLPPTKAISRLSSIVATSPNPRLNSTVSSSAVIASGKAYGQSDISGSINRAASSVSANSVATTSSGRSAIQTSRWARPR